MHENCKNVVIRPRMARTQDSRTALRCIHLRNNHIHECEHHLDKYVNKNVWNTTEMYLGNTMNSIQVNQFLSILNITRVKILVAGYPHTSPPEVLVYNYPE